MVRSVRCARDGVHHRRDGVRNAVRSGHRDRSGDVLRQCRDFPWGERQKDGCCCANRCCDFRRRDSRAASHCGRRHDAVRDRDHLRGTAAESVSGDCRRLRARSPAGNLRVERQQDAVRASRREAGCFLLQRRPTTSPCASSLVSVIAASACRAATCSASA